MALSLPEVQLRISIGLKKLNILRQERENLKEKIHFWESELTRLREQEGELQREAFNARLK